MNLRKVFVIVASILISQAVAGSDRCDEILEVSIPSAFRSVSRQMVKQDDALFKAYLGEKSRIQTCGPMCLLNISLAVDHAFHRKIPSTDTLSRFKVIESTMRALFSKPVDVGTTADQMALTASVSMAKLGYGDMNVEIHSIHSNGDEESPSLKDRLEKLGPFEVGVISINNHWIVVTDYAVKTDDLGWSDPNFPTLINSAPRLRISRDSMTNLEKIGNKEVRVTPDSI